MIERKSKTLTIRMTDNEYNKIRDLSNIYKCSMGEYLRMLLKEVKMENEKD